MVERSPLSLRMARISREHVASGKPPQRTHTPGEKPEDSGSKVWNIADTCPSVTGAGCSSVFPQHKVRQSNHQQSNATYLAADGGRIRSEGEVMVVHVASSNENVDIGVARSNVQSLCCLVARSRAVGAEPPSGVEEETLCPTAVL